MNARVQNHIAGGLSLRPPQAESLMLKNGGQPPAAQQCRCGQRCSRVDLGLLAWWAPSFLPSWRLHKGKDSASGATLKQRILFL
jgi:hypothetical protein